MNQRKIMDLLQEAARPNCTSQRRISIIAELDRFSAAMGPHGVYKIHGEEAVLRTLMGSLYVGAAKSRPELLPTLFPVFAAICGDREDGNIVAEVDWSLMC